MIAMQKKGQVLVFVRGTARWMLEERRGRTGVPPGVHDGDAQSAAVVLLGCPGAFERCHAGVLAWETALVSIAVGVNRVVGDGGRWCG